jgi:hypothetical protein
MSLIELPDGFQILEIGPHYKITPNSQYRTLAILGAKTKKLDDEFFTRELDLFMFLVSDMTPSLMMKPFKNATQILGANSRRNQKKVEFSFNLTSSIHPESFLKENRLKEKNAKDKEVFEDVVKNYSIMYANWSSEFTAKEPGMSNKTISRIIKIETDIFSGIFKNILLNKSIPDLYKEDKYPVNEWSKLRAKDLKKFFIRLDPRDFVSGNIYEWKGEAESTVENYMGIVKVLNLSKETLVDTEYTNDRIENKALHSFDLKLNWRCVEKKDLIVSFINHSNESSYWPVKRSCDYNDNLRSNFTLSYGQKIYQITNMSTLQPVMVDNNTFILENTNENTTLNSSNLLNGSYVLNGNFFFYLVSVNSSTRICVLDWSRNYSGSTYENECSQLKHHYINIKELSLEVIFVEKRINENKTEFFYLASIAEYSKSLKLYSKINLYVLRFFRFNDTEQKNITKSSLNLATQIVGGADEKAGGNQIGNYNSSDQYFSTDNLKFNYFQMTRNSSSDKSSWNISVFATNYRWKNNTNLFLYISHLAFTLNFTPNASSSVIELNRTDYSIRLFSLSSEYNSLRNMLRKVEIIPKQQYGLLGVEEDFSLVMNIKMGHSYILKINKSKFFNSDNRTELSLNNDVSIAVFENPFIGFQPEAQTPSPFYIDEYFFRVINLQNEAYLLNYKINHSKFLDQNTPLLNISKIQIKNIFCINFTSTNQSDGNLLDSCFTNTSSYITTSNIIKLKHKPVIFVVAPNFNITNDHEHKMISITDNEQLISTNFTSFINIRVQTHQLASNYLDLNITGPFSSIQAVRIRVRSGIGIASDQKFVIILIIISIVSILIAIVMSYLISRNTDELLIENKRFLMRSSLKPFSSAMVNIFKSSTKIKSEEEEKDKEEQLLQSQSSDESDEPEQKTHRHLKHPREPEEEHEPRHRDSERGPSKDHDRASTGQK